jgi:hypothetical protein
MKILDPKISPINIATKEFYPPISGLRAINHSLKT